MLSRSFRSLALSVVMASLVLLAQQRPAPLTLNLVITEGEGAINNIKLRTARETIVQVQDENHNPVADAAVVFLLPGNGPGGTFYDGSKSATVLADDQGRAVMPRMQLNSAPGRYEIKVHASYRGLAADATITQSTVVAAAAGLSTAAIIGIVAAAAGAAVVAGVVVSKGGGKSGGSSGGSTGGGVTTPSGTITVGSGVALGPPK